MGHRRLLALGIVSLAGSFATDLIAGPVIGALPSSRFLALGGAVPARDDGRRVFDRGAADAVRSGGDPDRGGDVRDLRPSGGRRQRPAAAPSCPEFWRATFLAATPGRRWHDLLCAARSLRRQRDRSRLAPAVLAAYLVVGALVVVRDPRADRRLCCHGGGCRSGGRDRHRRRVAQPVGPTDARGIPTVVREKALAVGARAWIDGLPGPRQCDCGGLGNRCRRAVSPFDRGLRGRGDLRRRHARRREADRPTRS